ncbi:hypothetical protein GEMRC1_003945 [Eukaryota sp. GEM-RC1]
MSGPLLLPDFPLSSADGPFFHSDEIFIHKVHDVDIEYKYTIGSSFPKCRGSIYLTTQRLYLDVVTIGSEIRSVIVPLACLSNEAFQQPIFGANNLTGVALLNDHLTLKFKASFVRGGSGLFMPKFFRALAAARRNPVLGNQGSSGTVDSQMYSSDAYLSGTAPEQVYIPEYHYDDM